MTRFYDFVAAMTEVGRMLGGTAEAVSCSGRTELHRRGGKTVKVERKYYFDDEGFNVYDVQEIEA